MTPPAARWPARPPPAHRAAGGCSARPAWWSCSRCSRVFPLVFSSPLATTYGFDALIFIAAATAWNIFSGYSGYLSLGHAIFFGTGMYTVAIAARDWNLTGDAVFGLLPLAAVVAAVIAVPVGLVALRVRRHTFVVITIAVFFIFQLMAFNFSFTGGTSGINAPILNWAPETYNDPFYYLALVIAVAVLALWLGRSGARVSACTCARSGTTRIAPAAWACTPCGSSSPPWCCPAFFTGLAGGLWYYFIGAVHPQSAYRPAVRPVAGADGVLRRARYRLRACARRADPRARRSSG